VPFRSGKLRAMVDVIGIDHLYISVSDLKLSERFYDRVMIETLGFRKNRFDLGGDPHIQYFNRQFGFVLRPSRESPKVDPNAPGLHHFCLRVDSIADVHIVAAKLRALGVDASESMPRSRGCIPSTQATTARRSSRTRMKSASRLRITGKSAGNVTTAGIALQRRAVSTRSTWDALAVDLDARKVHEAAPAVTAAG
jgi:glyoxylase I family protein